jgi:hypothetical protein
MSHLATDSYITKNLGRKWPSASPTKSQRPKPATLVSCSTC